VAPQADIDTPALPRGDAAALAEMDGPDIATESDDGVSD
jgi:hypothetical protein